MRPSCRRMGFATRLVEAVKAWARSTGVRELASDAEIGNPGSHQLMQGLDFEETERVVFFRKPLA